MEAYVNGTVEEQAAPLALQELQAAVVQAVHAMPVVVGAYQDALAAAAAADPQARWLDAAARCRAPGSGPVQPWCMR